MEAQTENLEMPEIKEISESIKLTKNSRGFNWEIKIFPNKTTDKEWLDRLSALNNEMMTRFNIE